MGHQGHPCRGWCDVVQHSAEWPAPAGPARTAMSRDSLDGPRCNTPDASRAGQDASKFRRDAGSTDHLTLAREHNADRAKRSPKHARRNAETTRRGLPCCAGEENSGPGDRAAASERLTGQSPPHPADVSSIDLQTGISKTGISVNVEPEDVPTAERPQLIPAWAGHTKPKRMAGAIRPSATSAYRIHRRSSPLSP